MATYKTKKIIVRKAGNEDEIYQLGGGDFPVGVIIETVSSTCPFEDGTWVEVVRNPPTWAQVESGTVSYSEGTGTGTIHYWKRTA